MSFLQSFSKIFGDWNAAQIKKLSPIVAEVRKVYVTEAYQKLSKEDLPRKTEEFKERVAKGESLEQILPEAFALVLRACDLLVGSEASLGKQTFKWDMRPFDVQILGGVALHRGCIAEMKTGEGKTLVCTMPVYLNALTGKGVHVITVNDYLAKRDSTWMGLLYRALGLSVGCVVHELSTEQRREAYGSDITYGTNNEFGFDYLRDNMVTTKSHQVQRGLHYAIVDEVDSILIDEARTPLIISQPAEESTAKYTQYARLARELQEHTHFVKDEKQRTATLTDDGIKKMEELLNVENIYTEKGFEEVHHIEQALRAHAIYQRDVDYVVKENEIIIVDEFTGRLMPGRRYGHGLHQAIEAKENVEVQRESKTLATITFQNYFRLYQKLAGMTGTAKTEEEEFESIYRLRTFVIPTHRPMVRDDQQDAVYRTVQAKFAAVVKLVKEKHALGQPVLVGTTSIEKSEVLHLLLEHEKVPHNVLNAKNHEKEAEIVALAGQKGAITIATNMAGRGTDIKLGAGVAALGGLCILGTERHESRRIDNQLRGRSGRQGDPGESQFFVSMEDDLMRLFGGDRLKAMMERLHVPDDVPLQNGMVSRSIEGAQKRVEGHHFDMRKHVLQYDDVMNKHREIIYKRRQKILDKLEEPGVDVTPSTGSVETPDADVSGAHFMETRRADRTSLHDDILTAIGREVSGMVAVAATDKDPDVWKIEELIDALAGLHPTLRGLLSVDALRKIGDVLDLTEHCTATVQQFYEDQCQKAEASHVVMAERAVTLRSIDTHWMDHIDDMSHLREQVAFAGFAQRDPVVEYQDQAFRRFQQLIARIDSTIVRTLLSIDFSQFAPRQVLMEAESEILQAQTNEAQIAGQLTDTGVDVNGMEDGSALAQAVRARPAVGLPTEARSAKVGRNDPCPCGSGKKYKKCHGQDE